MVMTAWHPSGSLSTSNTFSIWLSKANFRHSANGEVEINSMVSKLQTCRSWKVWNILMSKGKRKKKKRGAEVEAGAGREGREVCKKTKPNGALWVCQRSHLVFGAWLHFHERLSYVWAWLALLLSSGIGPFLMPWSCNLLLLFMCFLLKVCYLRFRCIY